MQGVMPILACADLCIRILEGSTVKETFYLSSEPVCMHLMKNNGGSYGNEVLVGLQNGHTILLKIEKYTENLNTKNLNVTPRKSHKLKYIYFLEIFQLVFSGNSKLFRNKEL